MKKLFYLLFAFALIVACEKDSYDQDVENINVLEQAEEINASVDSDAQLDAAFNFINELNNAVNSGEIKVTPKEGSSTAKAGDFGNNWIQLLFFDYTFINAFGERPYAYVRSDNNGVMCADVTEDASSSFADVMLRPSEISYSLRAHSNANLARIGRSELVIERIGVDGTVVADRPLTVVGADWGATFNADFNRIFAAAADRSTIAGGAAPPTSRFDVTNCSTGTATVYEYGTQIIGGAHDGRVIVPIDPTNMDSASNPTAAAVGTENIQLQLVRRVAGFGVLTWEAVGDPFTNPNYVTPTAARWEMTTPGGVMTFTRADMGSYRLEAAPFPLSGLIATVISEATGVEGTLNYAGTGSLGDATTHAAVRNAIETSFAN